MAPDKGTFDGTTRAAPNSAGKFQVGNYTAANGSYHGQAVNSTVFASAAGLFWLGDPATKHGIVGSPDRLRLQGVS